ncbi:DMT family transporter [Agromyces archimandritae]|uniref:DMT family transporter n=1 Tax=Agromyces archimandritae TaxID=2781962 RepID=A0A975FM32_9MICO|nr:DMT family transporter [Agromyces archimandritae]QTX03988.1 DMT family transporter [Agromyces archimandritae]
MSRRTPHLPVWLALVVAAGCGALMALQARINGELGERMHDGFAAAVVSFGVGLVILAVCLAASRRGRRGFAGVARALREGRLSWWMLGGGAAGAYLVLTQGLVAASLGVALFTVAIVAGQTVSGLVIDRIGLGPSGRHPLTLTRVLGAAVALAAVVWSVSGQFAAGTAWWTVALPLLAGLGMGWQQAVNGRVRLAADSALTATFVNFAVGTAALVVATIVHAAIVGPPAPPPAEPWLYLGGAIGCVFIALTAVLVRSTGVLLLGLATIAGQLLGALVLDLAAPLPGEGLEPATIAGTILALAAVAIGSWAPRRARA